ncbi:hypothetical protein TK0580 [Thermococcus kodakarensis KOD1]|uniref:Uncharacterized protein n=1 Tax=Thermococcus kodakarensis (strain ATCC BAA-918 / JCM 12380 / KOD1) TaxID=69014 RepID=Q5JFD5_THEKO|nr:hypothetical protein [Thermococcus kodakarensis]WCN28626.1 hypothetical protein POG15_02975 [Thermococcus kodakarensis]WCN30924.1 hypothetical protein POG21_02975 [Thermococcus kodakarensis]BAD84769.1 hypothetical protein TK0580 [Thermococcus kodakarensis KOD1]
MNEEELYTELLRLRGMLNDVIDLFEMSRDGYVARSLIAEAWTDFNIQAGKINTKMYAYAYQDSFIQKKVQEGRL